MKKCVLLVLGIALVFSLTSALGYDTGFVDYETFIGRYAGNLEFINDNAERHLISLYFASGDTEKSYRVYTLSGDVLTATLRTSGSGRTVAMLSVTLTAPSGMSNGDALYKDFVTSGYHCYALLMAMSPAEECADRFTLIEEINAGLNGETEYHTFVGAYTLACRRSGENSVTFTFSSSLWEDPLNVEEDGEEALRELETTLTEEEQEDNQEEDGPEALRELEEDPSDNQAG